jgi:hypothetical protein
MVMHFAGFRNGRTAERFEEARHAFFHTIFINGTRTGVFALEALTKPHSYVPV